MLDNSWDQACLPINETSLGRTQSTDQVQAAYIDSVLKISVLVEKVTGRNQISFVNAIKELSKIETTYPSQRKNQEELDY